MFSQDTPGFPKAASKAPGPSPSWAEVPSVSTLAPAQRLWESCPSTVHRPNWPQPGVPGPRPKRQAGIHLWGFPDPAHTPSQPAENVTGSKHPDCSYSSEGMGPSRKTQLWSPSTRGRTGLLQVPTASGTSNLLLMGDACFPPASTLDPRSSRKETCLHSVFTVTPIRHTLGA